MFSAFFSYFSHWRLYFLLIAIHLILNTNRNAGSLFGMEKIITVIYARRQQSKNILSHINLSNWSTNVIELKDTTICWGAEQLWQYGKGCMHGQLKSSCSCEILIIIRNRNFLSLNIELKSELFRSNIYKKMILQLKKKKRGFFFFKKKRFKGECITCELLGYYRV